MRRALVVVAVGLGLGLGLGCGGKTETTQKKSTHRKARVEQGTGKVQIGLSAWYGGKHHGGPTASGERFNKHAMTAAHRKLPFGTRVRVTHRKTGKSVVVRINDRGPYGRAIIDVSEAAAKELGIIKEGVAPVRIEVLE